MITTMDANGVITISPETPLEAFALKEFVKKAHVFTDDTERNEQCYLRGSCILISVSNIEDNP